MEGGGGQGRDLGEEGEDLDLENGQDHDHADVLDHGIEGNGPVIEEGLNQDRGLKAELGLQESLVRDRNPNEVINLSQADIEKIRKRKIKREVKILHQEKKRLLILRRLRSQMTKIRIGHQKKVQEPGVKVGIKVDQSLVRKVDLLLTKVVVHLRERKVVLPLVKRVDLLHEGRVGQFLERKAGLPQERKVARLQGRRVDQYQEKRVDHPQEKRVGLLQGRRAGLFLEERQDHHQEEKVGALEDVQGHLVEDHAQEVEGKAGHPSGEGQGPLGRVDPLDGKEAEHLVENEVGVRNGGAGHLLHLLEEELNLLHKFLYFFC